MKKFGVLLRTEKEIFPCIENILAKYSDVFDEVTIFSQVTHSVKNLDEHQKDAKIIEPMLRKIEKMGIKSGINVHGSLGFFPEILDEKMDEYTFAQDLNGNVNKGKLCISNKNNHEYIKEYYKMFANISPSRIYIDDDYSGIYCYCPDCIKRFGEKYHYEVSDNTELMQLFSDEENRKSAREDWLKYNAERINDVYAVIENAVHQVNPEIELGFMTFATGCDGIDTDTWATTLKAGKNHEVSIRPGGGVYTEFSLGEVLDKANRIGVQIRYLPDFVTKIESEIENFPAQTLRKTASFTAFESLVYLAAGCTGSAFNTVVTEEGVYGGNQKYLDAIKEVSVPSRIVVDAFQTYKPEGVGFYWNKTTTADHLNPEWNYGGSVNVANKISESGFPIAYDPDKMQVILLNARAVSQMTDDELTDCFKKGILMDCSALTECNKRGFSQLTGFKVSGEYKKDTLEKHLSHPFNVTAGYERNIRQAFGFNNKPSYTIESIADSAEYFVENRDLSGNLRGYASGVFENKLGGRVCVMGINPFDWYEHFLRKEQLKNVLRWLSKDSLPAYLNSFHRMALWSRGDALFLANMAMEDAQEVELMVKTDAKRFNVMVTKGSKIVFNETVDVTESDFGYSSVKLPEVPITGTVLLKPLK